MPKLDGTGPMGFGPRTGRGFGPCCVNFRGRSYVSKKNQLLALEEEEKILKEELAAIQEEKIALQKEAE